MQPKFKRILYGGDYNPNQWPEEIWKEDMRIFKDARINSATINVFSWAKIQPSENEYNFSELDKVVEMLSEENYDIVFATSTAALPGSQKLFCTVMYMMRHVHMHWSWQRKKDILLSIRLMILQLLQDRVPSQWRSFRNFRLLIISWSPSVEADLQQVFPHLRNC